MEKAFKSLRYIIICYFLRNQANVKRGTRKTKRRSVTADTLSRAKWVTKPELFLLTSSLYPPKTLSFGIKTCIPDLKIKSSEY